MFEFWKKTEKVVDQYVPPPNPAIDQRVEELESEPEEPKKTYRVELCIGTDKREFSWSMPKDEERVAREHYPEFTAWFHEAEDPLYRLYHMDGVTCFRRQDIRWYTITIKEDSPKRRNVW